MNELRRQFEELPSIKTFMPSFKFDEKTGEYVRSGAYHQPYYTLGFFNGAWWAFQEQQKIINMQECGAIEIRMILDDVEYDDITKLERIKELLK